MSIQERIKQDITNNKIMLFVKGEKNAPQCGFSAAVLDAFHRLNVPFEVRNVLADPELRDGIKAFSNWPTIPQIYINGEFIGGCDITLEMFKSGELQEKIESALKS